MAIIVPIAVFAFIVVLTTVAGGMALDIVSQRSK
jgi:hypothetical protein